MQDDWLTRDGHLTALSLERHLAGEIDAGDHLAACAPCQARFAALEADEAKVQLRPPRAAPAPSRWPLYGGILAAAAAVVFFVLRPTGGPVDPGGADGIRTKGGFAFEVHAHDGQRSRQLFDGDAVGAGERLGFRVQSDVAGHLLIVGRDGAGERWLAYPQQGGGASVAFGPSPLRDLGEAIQLDATPGDEQLTALLCAAPVHRAAIGGEAPAGCRARRITLKKRP